MLSEFAINLKSMVRQYPAATGSLLLHGTIFLLLVSSITFSVRNDNPPSIPIDIMQELLPVKEVTNVKPKKRAIPRSPVRRVSSKPKYKAPPKPVKKVARKTPAKPVKKIKKKPKVDEFASVLKALDAMREEASEKIVEHDSTIPLSMSEKDKIRNQLIKCWSIPASAQNAEHISVVVTFSLAQDGSLSSPVKIADMNRYEDSSEFYFRAMADSAVTAVLRCSPLKNLPVKKYKLWQKMKFRFDPRDSF